MEKVPNNVHIKKQFRLELGYEERRKKKIHKRVYVKKGNKMNENDIKEIDNPFTLYIYIHRKEEKIYGTR